MLQLSMQQPYTISILLPLPTPSYYQNYTCYTLYIVPILLPLPTPSWSFKLIAYGVGRPLGPFLACHSLVTRFLVILSAIRPATFSISLFCYLEELFHFYTFQIYRFSVILFYTISPKKKFSIFGLGILLIYWTYMVIITLMSYTVV